MQDAIGHDSAEAAEAAVAQSRNEILSPRQKLDYVLGPPDAEALLTRGIDPREAQNHDHPPRFIWQQQDDPQRRSIAEAGRHRFPDEVNALDQAGG